MSGKFWDVALLIALAGIVVLLTKVLVRGIEMLAKSGGMSAKTKGQFLGYATSTPELVATVGTAGRGLLGAGLWNIAAYDRWIGYEAQRNELMDFMDFSVIILFYSYYIL